MSQDESEVVQDDGDRPYRLQSAEQPERLFVELRCPRYVPLIQHHCAEAVSRHRDAYPAAKLGRPKEIKRMYDPADLFRFNLNPTPFP